MIKGLHLKSAPEQRTATVRLEHKKLNDSGEFEGYGSVFGVKDSYDEIVAEGAFAASLAEHAAEGTLPAMLWQHDAHSPIGSYVEMREDKKGLFVRGELELDTQKGKEAYALLKRGSLNGLSIGFMPRKWEYSEDTGIRTLTEIELWEVSLVTFPANGSARVSGTKALNRISDITDWKGVEKYLREGGSFSQDAATAMVATVKRIADSEREVRTSQAKIKSSAEQLLELLKS